MFQDGKFHVIPSVRQMKHLDKALSCQEEWLVLSCAHIGNLRDCVDKCHRAGKKVIVNYELVGGLGSDKIAFELLRNMYRLDAVMGTNSAKLNHIRREKLPTIRRASLEDSLAFDLLLHSIKDSKNEAIELRPAYYGLKFLPQLKKEKDGCYILGGFVDSKECIQAAYEAGFDAVATSSPALWGFSPKTR